MSEPAMGLLMLVLIVIVIMMGFPTAFTLMGLGMFFGFGYFMMHEPNVPLHQSKVFDLMVERTFGAMNNEVLISIPLFVLMGYVMERGALVDKMFYSIQLAFRKFPASLAVATLIVCTFWGIASGLVGAVVVLMGVIAFNPMLKAGYNVKLAAGVITAGGTLGILIPPSVMIIVYAAVAGQSVVKLYAAAMFPGFFLAFLYLVYIVGWALIDPKIAPPLPEAEQKIPVPDWVNKFQQAYANNMLVGIVKAVFSPGRAIPLVMETGRPLGYVGVWKSLGIALFPLILAAVTLWGAWWYVVIHQQADKLAEAAIVKELAVNNAKVKAAAAEAAAAGAAGGDTEGGVHRAGRATIGRQGARARQRPGCRWRQGRERVRRGAGNGRRFAARPRPGGGGGKRPAARVLRLVLGHRRSHRAGAALVLRRHAGGAV